MKILEGLWNYLNNRRAMTQQRLQIRGGSAASAGPSMESTPKERPQQGDETSMTKDQLSKVQAKFNQACNEVERLVARLRDPSFTTEDMNRLEFLQPVVNQCRKQIGLLQAKGRSSRRIFTAGRHD